MSLSILIIVIMLAWVFIHLRRRHTLSNVARFPLPITTPGSSQQVSESLWKIGQYADIDLLSFFILRGRTKLFVDSHARQRAKQIRWSFGGAIKFIYNLGTVTAIVGQTLAVGVLWWSLFQLGIHLIHHSTSSHAIQNGAKRSLPPISQSHISSNEFFLRPLIPGLTLPLSHIFPIIVSLIACTSIHELGHALAAAADGIPLISWGYSLIVVIPAAFVELASPITNKKRPPSLRLRLSAAGAYHNLITILVLFLLSSLSLDKIMWPLLGYRDIDEGVVVVDVDEESALRSHLSSGSIITRIDDAALVTTLNYSAQYMWSALLLDSVQDDAIREGWCVNRGWFESHSEGCCPGSLSDDVVHRNGSCFIRLPSSLTARGKGRCIDSVSLFETKATQRCESNVNCDSSNGQSNIAADMAEEDPSQICISPHISARLLRISFTESPVDKTEKLIVWHGPTREVWEQVTIGKYYPRMRILPLTFPSTVELLFE
ncbi:hypothetical protein K439DRAFT_41271 [Ramaria rubella]|nr:hypothetical protein K439DRAFT_41271 [Ramaria rubella]